MTLGDYLKQQRNTQNLSQAELAERMGIEQSYLSKLEGDRSLPSESIFTAWLIALELSVDDVLSKLDKSYLHAKLDQIPAVRHWLREHSMQTQFRAQFTVYLSIFLIAFAVPLFYLGHNAMVFSETHYEYHSPGIVMPGERPDIFTFWHRLNHESPEAAKAFRNEMIQREDRAVLIVSDYRGEQFNRPAPEAVDDVFTRTYYLEKTFAQPRWPNTLMQALGLFFGVFGAVSLGVGARRNKK